MDIFFIFLFGLAIGSFLNVVIYRVPLGKSLITPPSSCPKCNTKLKPIHNIPVISWILLKGRCASCGEKISIRYPLIELLTGIIAVLIYIKLGNFDIFYLFTFGAFATLLALCMIDFDYKAVPDSLNLLALTFAFFHSPEVLENFKNALLMMGGMSLVRYYVSYFLKREAMGEGDIIVGGTMGALVGIKLAVLSLFIAALLAIIPSLYFRLQKKEPELPFIPFLALGTFIVWYFDSYFEEIWRIIYE